MLGGMRIIQCAHSNAMPFIVNGTVDVVNCVTILVADTHFAFSFFTLFYKIKDQERASVAFKQILKMKLCGMVCWIDAIQFNCSKNTTE